MKFILLVEGRSEGTSAGAFLKRWLDPKLAQRVGVQVVTFDGYAGLVRKIKPVARLHLEGRKSGEVIAVVALLDLYGPQFYPPGKTSVEERHAWAQEHFEREVGLERFRMFFAVHEFEAWLLSQPEIFPREVAEVLRRSQKPPEKVNFDKPPGKLLEEVYLNQMRKGYKKVSYGAALFSKLDPAVAYEKCPYLKAMLDALLELAVAAGASRAADA